MKRCSYCAEDVQDAALKCKHCGEMIGPTDPNEIWASSPKSRIGYWVWLSIAVIATTVIYRSPNDSEPAQKEATSSPTQHSPQEKSRLLRLAEGLGMIEKKASEKAVTFVSDSCSSLSEKFGNLSSLSELQKKELWKKYPGKGFIWKMKVVEVDSNTFDGFSVQFLCDPTRSLILDVTVRYPAEAENAVMQFEKDKVYSVKGILDDYSGIFGLSADSL